MKLQEYARTAAEFGGKPAKLQEMPSGSTLQSSFTDKRCSFAGVSYSNVLAQSQTCTIAGIDRLDHGAA
jgi:hypothetical protein